MIGELMNWVTLTHEGVITFYFGLAAAGFSFGMKVKVIKVTFQAAQ